MICFSTNWYVPVKVLFLRTMKKAGIISLLLIILFQMVGVFMLFKIKQAEIRQEVKMRIKSGVPEGEITVLRFDSRIKNDLLWIEDHEFVYKDHMYDVVKTTREGHFVNYHCLPDTLETRLFKNLNRVVANEMNRDKTNSKQKYHIAVNWFYPDAGGIIFFNNQKIDKITVQYRFAVISQINTPDPPPPKRMIIQGIL